MPAVMLRLSKRSSAETAVLFSLIDSHVCTLKPVFWDQDSLGLLVLVFYWLFNSVILQKLFVIF